MFENDLNYPTTDGAMIAKRKPDITIGQNLDAQIEETERRLNDLKATKVRLESTGLLDSRIDDLRQAMNY